jgi:hypothetical protein
MRRRNCNFFCFSIHAHSEHFFDDSMLAPLRSFKVIRCLFDSMLFSELLSKTEHNMRRILATCGTGSRRGRSQVAATLTNDRSFLAISRQLSCANSGRAPLDLFFEMMSAEDSPATPPLSAPSSAMAQSSSTSPPASALSEILGLPGVVKAVHPGAAVSPHAVASYIAPRVADPQERFHVSDPTADGMMLFDVLGDDATSDATPPSSSSTLASAYAASGPSAIWKLMRKGAGDAAALDVAPLWFTNLCRDLYFRTTDGERPAPSAGEMGAPEPLPEATDAPPAVDPFLWIDFQLLADTSEYKVGPFRFSKEMEEWFENEDRERLCLGDAAREYVCFAEGYCFPERHQFPTSLGTVPLRLLLDPRKEEPTIFIQLSPDVPPCMWLPVKPNAAAIRRVISEFAAAAASHRDAHHDHLTLRWDLAHRTLVKQRMNTSDGDIMRMMAYKARDVPFGYANMKEFPNRQEFFLGEYDDPERLMEYFDLCPFVFSTPLMRTVADVHDPQYVPRIDGPGIATNLYRTVFSKSLLFVQVHLATEVKLPPQDPDAFVFMWRDAESLPKSKIPVFVRAVWPDNQRMSGGGRLVRRFNQTFGTEFAEDVPIDVCLAVWSLMTWSRNRSELLGITGMRARLAQLDEAARRGEQTPLLYPGTREIPNPEYTLDEQVGMHIQYLAHMGDPEARDRVVELWQRSSPAIRMGCAKAALTLEDRALFRRIVSSEPEGRMQTYMTKLVKKRKTRDLTDAVPRLLDEQYEFAAPLWTKRSSGNRIVDGQSGTLL